MARFDDSIKARARSLRDELLSEIEDQANPRFLALVDEATEPASKSQKSGVMEFLAALRESRSASEARDSFNVVIEPRPNTKAAGRGVFRKRDELSTSEGTLHKLGSSWVVETKPDGVLVEFVVGAPTDIGPRDTFVGPERTTKNKAGLPVKGESQ